MAFALAGYDDGTSSAAVRGEGGEGTSRAAVWGDVRAWCSRVVRAAAGHLDGVGVQRQGS